MDFRTLEMFVCLADKLHFGRASDAMHVSPSALSRQIQRLEAELGTRLFIRDNRNVSLTQQGKQALQDCQLILLQWQQLTQQFANPDELSGQLQLYCSVTAAQTFMRQFIERFRADYPMVSLTVETGDAALALEKISTEQADIAIATRPDSIPNGIKMFELYRSPLVFIRPKMDCGVRTKTTTDTIDWQQLPVIVAQLGLSRERLFSWYEQHQMRPDIYAEVAGHEAIVAMVGLGLGVGMIPEIVLQQSSVTDQVEVFQRADAMPPYFVSLCCLERRLQDPVIAAFWHTATQPVNTRK